VLPGVNIQEAENSKVLGFDPDDDLDGKAVRR
jgi:hypothetical protein